MGYWQDFYSKVNSSIEEDFQGNLSTLKNAKVYNDPYIVQMEQMGVVIDGVDSKCFTFESAIQWIKQQLSNINKEDVIWPARVFAKNGESKFANYTYENKSYAFVIIGEEIPDDFIELDGILLPHVFVAMLSCGYFPIGGNVRGNTNQSLALHDVAHMAGFISSPQYMKTIRTAFSSIHKECKNNVEMRKGLESFDSKFSIRIYYMIEVFIEIPECNKKKLYDILQTDESDYTTILNQMKKMSKSPTVFYRYLNTVYESFPALSNCLGGESRDIINRVRKFYRPDGQVQEVSKFKGSSLYYMYQQGLSLLKNVRSTHSDYNQSISTHAAFVCALINTSKLTVEDWVLESAKFQVNKNSKLYQYICCSGIWDETHLLYKSFSDK